MKTIVLCIILVLGFTISCGKKERSKGKDKTPAPAAAPVTVHSLAELVRSGRTAEFTVQLAELTAIQINDAVDGTGMTLAMLAAKKGNIEALKAIVGKAARLDLQDRSGATALHHGVAFVPVIQLLLERKVDPDKADLEDRTALHAAIAMGRCDVMNLLLAAGANRNARDRQGTTPLHLAAAQADAACLSGLLERKANVNASDVSGLTPVLAAAQAGNVTALELLIKAGASISKRTKKGDTALHLCVEAKTPEVLKYLVEKKKQDPDPKNAQGQTPLHAAAQAGNGQAVIYLLSKKAYVGAKDRDGRIPLHAAAGRGRLDVVRLLLEKKTWIDNTDFRKRTPLMLAIMNGKVEVASYLVTQGASLQISDNEGFTALHHAIVADNQALATAIIEKSGKIDVPTKSGLSPLHLAASRGQEKMVRLLVDKGANLRGKDRRGNHPFHLALDDTPPLFPGEPDDLKAKLAALAPAADPALLKAQIAWLEERKRDDEARRNGRIACARLLIEKGSDLTARDHSGRDALQAAAASGMKELFDWLRGKGLKGDKPDFRMRTLLYHAAIGGNLEIVKAAMDMGFTEVAFKYKREVPLHVAAEFNRQEVIRFLLGKGSQVDALSTGGETALLYAAKNFSHQAAAALLDAGATNVSPPSLGEPGGDTAGEKEPAGEPGDPGDSGDSDEDALRTEALAELNRMETKGARDEPDRTPFAFVFNETLKNTTGSKGRTLGAGILLNRQLAFLELLFKKGSSPDALLGDEPIAWHAAKAGHLELMTLILDQKPALKYEGGEPLAMAALHESHYELTQFLLERGLVPAKDPANLEALRFILNDERITNRAAALAVFTALLKTVDDLNAVGESGDSLLHSAVAAGRIDFVQVLLSAGPSLDLVNKAGETPAHTAVRGGSLKMVALFLDKEPRVAQGALAFVPLAAGSLEVLQWLLKKGYRDIETADGKVSGLFLAASAGNWAAFQLLSNGRAEALKALDADGASIAHYAAIGGSEKIVKALEKAGISFATPDKNGKTPLHAAAARGAGCGVIEVFRKLAEVIKAADADKNTPLHLAVKARNTCMIEWLVNNGADPGAVDGAGKKPADYADDAIKPLLP